jgi:hypothetical protein
VKRCLIKVFTVALVCGLAVSVLGQFRGRRRPPPTGIEPIDRGNVPSWPVSEGFAGDTFTFARLKYHSSSFERSSFAWFTDYPDADLNLSFRLHQLTSMEVSPEPKVIEITDPELFNYPWVFMSGAGNIVLSEEEASVLRQYLLNGGFLMIDDFWGQQEWDGVYHALKMVLPDREPVDIARTNEMFRSVFNIPANLSLQTPNMYAAIANRNTGVTWEDNHAGGNTREVHFRGIFDAKGRLMVMICHNTDNGDGWEEESSDPWFFREFSEKKNYPFGFDVIIYSLTH